MKFKLEYIWLDGYEPVPNQRSKTKIVSFEATPTLEQLPLWNFDGSSTRQADGSSSDCFLQPVALFPDPARNRGHLVMCEVLLPDGTPHPSNSRGAIPDDPDAWFGFEQEYFTALMSAFSDARDKHIACYGPENDLRLTGLHETAAIDEFTYGIADRGASIRIPHSFVNSGHRGYLEDRRPNSMADPYRITGRIVQTIESVAAQALIEDAFAA